MSLIVCDEHCRHQQDGYCMLNRISCLTSDRSARCGYYEARDKKGSESTAKEEDNSLF